MSGVEAAIDAGADINYESGALIFCKIVIHSILKFYFKLKFTKIDVQNEINNQDIFDLLIKNGAKLNAKVYYSDMTALMLGKLLWFQMK